MKLSQNKRFLGQAIVIIAAFAMITGTFAWSSFSQRAFNPTWDEGNYGGRIRDEYDGYGSGDHNKDVFAENFGNRNIFVRVRLSEFLAIDGDGVLDMDRNDVSTWAVYCSEDDDVFTPRAGTDIAVLHGDEPDGYGISWTLGHNETKYFMPTFNQAIQRATDIGGDVPELFADVDAYLFSEATGRGVDAIASMNMINTDLLADNRELFELTAEHARDFFEMGYQTGPGDGSHNWALEVELEDDGEGNLVPVLDADGFPVLALDGEGNVIPRTVEDYLIRTVATAEVVELVNEGLVTHTAQRTLEPDIFVNPASGMTADEFEDLLLEVLNLDAIADFNGIMTLTQFEALGMPRGNFWILDNTMPDCGWFYWNGFLPPGEATSLLLDRIYLPERNASWEHIIHVEADFFTQSTLEDEEQAPNFENMPPVLFELFMSLDPLVRPNRPADPDPTEPTEPTEPAAPALNTPRITMPTIANLSTPYELTLHFSSATPRGEIVADQYAIYVDGVEVARHTDSRSNDPAVSARAFNMSGLNLEPGEHVIAVRAISLDQSVRTNSNLSESVVFVIGEDELPPAPALNAPRITDPALANPATPYALTLHFSSATPRGEIVADQYAIYVDGVEVARHTDVRSNDPAVSARAFDLSTLDLESGEYEIAVRAISNDQLIRINSEMSNIVTFTVE